MAVIRKDPLHGVISSFLAAGVQLRARFDEVAGEYKASAPQIMLVTQVLTTDGITIGELAQRMKVRPSVAETMVADLVLHRVLSVKADCDDLAESTVSVTPFGRAWHKKVNLAYHSSLRQVFASINSADREQMRVAFDRLVAVMTERR